MKYRYMGIVIMVLGRSCRSFRTQALTIIYVYHVFDVLCRDIVGSVRPHN